jgi:uncharacterized membrane protein
MIREEGNVVIQRPVEEVFAYVSDLTHSAEWQAGLVEVRRLTEGPLGVGTRYAFVRQFMGRKMEASNEFVAYEPNTTVRFRIPSGPMPGHGTYLFEATPDGTKVTSRVELQPRGLSRLAAPLIGASLRREIAAGLPVLKELLEGQVSRDRLEDPVAP